jgi:hypothetical protein
MDEKHPGGRPPYVPNDKDRRIVEAMARSCTHDQIARALDISDETMRKYYRRELDTAKDAVDAAVGQCLIFQAVGGPEQDWTKAIPASTIFYAKTRMGWKEPAQEVKHGGGLTVKAITANMTPQEAAEAFAATLRGAKRAPKDE